MQLMHEHYRGFDERMVQRWLTKPRDGGRVAELFGCFSNEALTPNGPLLVLGITSRLNEREEREAVFAEYFGVAADTFADREIAEVEIRDWYSQFVCKLRRLAPEGTFKSFRPKTMSCKPMQRLHDLVTEGTAVFDEVPSGQAMFRVLIDEEQDRGGSLYWMLRIVPCATA